ncbi:MAG: lipid A phosphate methyltransferase [bacterium]|nr:lipid A phosphate methyltransferase [bacterium]
MIRKNWNRTVRDGRLLAAPTMVGVTYRPQHECEITMALKEEFVLSGNWLFRRRGYLPVIVLALVLICMRGYTYLGGEDSLLNDLWEICCLCVSCFGLLIRCYTIGHTPSGTSGRNTSKQEAESLNTTGIYSAVRHPLYLGIFFMWLGISAFMHIWWLTLIVCLIFWIYYERIMFAEEEFLRGKFGPAYDEWAARTPAFFPRFTNWVKPSLPFSLRTVLLREYHGLLAMIVTYVLLEIVSNVVARNEFYLSRMWLILLIAGVVIFTTLRILKKKTRVLFVDGR